MSRRRSAKQLSPDVSSSDEEPSPKRSTIQKNIPKEVAHSTVGPRDDSSSESDIETYLHKPDKLDFSSSFFNSKSTKQVSSFDDIERNIFESVTRLNNSSDESDIECNATETKKSAEEPQAAHLNFQQLHDFTKNLEETKKQVELYNAKKKSRDKQFDVLSLLKAGETGLNSEKEAALAELEGSLHSSDFESCSDSEKEGWEEVKAKETPKKAQKNDLQITIQLPGTIRKKKGPDLLAAMKRRFNRIKKENQLLMHKVHLLCWIAHGNYLNSILNSEDILALSLSLIPSQCCYPAGRMDISYLENILKWYRNTIPNLEKDVPGNLDFTNLLQLQMKNKQVYNKSMLVYIFISMLRSMGIKCRLALSFQIVPLRPPNSELCSLSSKSEEKKSSKSTPSMSKSTKKNTKGKAEENGLENCSETEEVEKLKENVTSMNPSASLRKKAEKSTKSTKSLMVPVDDKQRSKSADSVKRKSKELAPKETTKETRSRSTGYDKDSKGKQQKKAERSSKSTKTLMIPVNDKQRSKSADSVKPKSKELASKETTNETLSRSTDYDKNSKGKEQSNKRGRKSSRTTKSDEKETTKSEYVIKIKSPVKNKVEPKRNLRSNAVPQVDGADDSDSDEVFLQMDGANDSPRTSKRPNLRKLKQVRKSEPCPSKHHKNKNIKYRDSDSEEDFRSTSSLSPKPKPNLKKLKSDVRDDIVKLVKGRIKEQKQLDTVKKVRHNAKRDSDDDSDYLPQETQKKPDENAPKVKKRVLTKKMLSENLDEGNKKRMGVDVWAEVFLEAEEKWISVDVVKGQVHCINELYKRATHPVSYIVVWNNNNFLKDVTRRYCPNYNTATRKLRIDKEWWDGTLKPFMGVQTAVDKEEDGDLDRQHLEQPLPTSIAEYKNHPLYVLKRHLLKFQGIYPSDAATLGFVRNEAVYSRDCVYTLHSRDIWLKHAKVVKLGETPYKIVKARPKYDKLSNTIITDQLLEIFGPWQTEDYVPPTASNGIVPRNAFGNVELFKSCMLPKKTIHLQLPGLNKVARKLNIDCAPALVGFDFHAGWSHPTYDGFVVCEEYGDQLIKAWEEDREEMQKKEEDKIEKRVYGNWKKLIKGLFIRERLKVKYEFGTSSSGGGGEAAGPSKKRPKGPQFATKKRRVCSDSESSD